MARARKGTNSPKTFPNNMSRKQMKRKKPIDSSYMVEIKPLTDNQKTAFEQHELGKNLLLHGAAVLVRLSLLCILLYSKCLTKTHLMIRYTL